MNKTSFYDIIRAELFKGKITPDQFGGIEAILTACSAACINDMRWVAYMLGTALHETGKTMQPIEEYGKGKAYDYGKMLDMGKGSGKRVAYTTPAQLYYGRGLVQITWRSNYANMGRILGLPLLEHPELALTPIVAAKIMIEGMTRGKSSFGDFTGKSLEDYFSATKTDWINARRIINGLDVAERIAGYAQIFYKAIIAE